MCVTRGKQLLLLLLLLETTTWLSTEIWSVIVSWASSWVTRGCVAVV